MGGTFGLLCQIRNGHWREIDIPLLSSVDSLVGDRRWACRNGSPPLVACAGWRDSFALRAGACHDPGPPFMARPHGSLKDAAAADSAGFGGAGLNGLYRLCRTLRR